MYIIDMKAGMLKLRNADHTGFVWVQCEKVCYVKEDFRGDGQCTVVGMTSGDELRVKEAATWVRREICPPH